MEKIKEMENLKEKTIAEIVAEDISKASVFKKHDIDFCCGGGKKLSVVCESKGLNLNDLIDELLTEKPATDQKDFNSWTLSFLADYIVNVHHNYIKENIPIITEFAEKVAKVHGNANPEVIEIRDLFAAQSNELTHHMHKEEMVLFPAIKRIETEGAQDFPFGSIDGPINMMMMEHESAGDILKRIKELSNNYTPPEHACNTYKALYHNLGQYMDDLLQHIHLENNILFPKAQAMLK